MPKGTLMNTTTESQLVTVIYYEEASLMIKHDVQTFEVSPGGRVVLPMQYKKGKSVIAVCEGRINLLNKMGDRVLPANKTEMKDQADLSFH